VQRLQLHHVDHDHENHAPDNLMTLCASCHTRWHHEHEGHPRWRRTA
jgi:hypothetical protein